MAFWPYVIEAFCIFLLRIRVSLRIAAIWCFGIMDKLGHVSVNLAGIDRIVGEVPVVIQRIAVVRVERLIRQSMPSVPGGLM
ncbi:hypothetical protein A5701_21005 [Mycobacterium sp. E3305]|nr:hypothetical protein A5701_21005 [Mycobacterium sp. E3305]